MNISTYVLTYVLNCMKMYLRLVVKIQKRAGKGRNVCSNMSCLSNVLVENNCTTWASRSLCFTWASIQPADGKWTHQVYFDRSVGSAKCYRIQVFWTDPSPPKSATPDFGKITLRLGNAVTTTGAASGVSWHSWQGSQ